MVKPFQLLVKALENSRTRMMVIGGFAVVIIGVIIIGYKALHSASMISGNAQLATIPKNIQSVPGVTQQSDQYLQTLLQSNQQAAQVALKSGQSEIPTLVPTQATNSSANFNAQGVPQTGSPCCCQVCAQANSSQANADKQSLTPNALTDQLASSGDIDAATAQAIKALNGQGLTPENYASQLNNLVQQGKLSPADAQKLMAAYEKQQGSASPQADAAVDQLLATGAISPETAAAIKALDSQGLTPDQYANALNKLVQQGKLTPAQARQLLAAYTADQQSANGGAGGTPATNALIGQLAASGLDPSTAAQLKALTAQGLTPDQYGNALNSLVQQGKLTPAQAQQLLAAYTADKQNQGAGPGADNVVDQLAAAGSISPETAAALKALDSEGLSAADYGRRLNQLVQEGKLTPQQARQLLAAYEQQTAGARSGIGTTGLVQQLQSSGSISPATANALNSLASQGLSPQAYKAALNRLVANGSLTPEEARMLAAAYDQQASGGGALAQLQQIQQAQEAAQEQQQLQAQQQVVQQQQQQALQQEMQSVETAVANQASKLFSAWSTPTQAVTGSFAGTSSNDNAGAAGGAGTAGSQQAGAAASPIILTGDVLFAVLTTSINSDQPGPVMATVVSGKFKGAKLIGGLKTTPDGQAVTLSFNRMIMPDWPTSAGINAVAINPDTARTALASSVNNHYLSRYGSVFATAFLQGFGQAVGNSGQTIVSSLGTTSQSFNQLTTAQEALVGLGQVGQALGSQAQNGFNRPPTVKVNSGTGVGVLFMNDVTLPVAGATQNAGAGSSGSADSSAPDGSAVQSAQASAAGAASGLPGMPGTSGSSSATQQNQTMPTNNTNNTTNTSTTGPATINGLPNVPIVSYIPR